MAIFVWVAAGHDTKLISEQRTLGGPLKLMRGCDLKPSDFLARNSPETREKKVFPSGCGIAQFTSRWCPCLSLMHARWLVGNLAVLDCPQKIQINSTE